MRQTLTRLAAYGLATALTHAVVLAAPQCPPRNPIGFGGTGAMNPNPNDPNPPVPGRSEDKTKDHARFGPARDPVTGGGDTPPRTGAPRPPLQPGRTGAGRRGGMTLAYTRGSTSRARLKIQWDYPDIDGEQRLDRESALAALRGEDPRPLLVMRECRLCTGSDAALLDRKLNNEKTLLLARWFHCVRLTNRVLDEKHPLNALFEGPQPPHVFLASAGGRTLRPFDGRRPQRVLWRGMYEILKPAYRKDPAAAARAWMRLLNEYDTIDSQEQLLRERIRLGEFEHGRDWGPLAKMPQKLAELKARRAKLEKREAGVRDLGLLAAKEKESALLDKIRR